MIDISDYIPAAALELLGHDLFYVVDGEVHLDTTDEPVDSQMQEQIDARAIVMATPTLESTVAEALALIADEHAGVLRKLTGGATVEERDTWVVKERWATTYKAGDPSSEPFLLGIMRPSEIDAAADAGLDPATVMADKILGKARYTEALIATAEQVKRTAEEEVGEADSIEAVQGVLASIPARRDTAIADFLQRINAGA